MEKFDIRRYKYSLILFTIVFLFALVVSNAYKYLPKYERINSDIQQEILQDDDSYIEGENADDYDELEEQEDELGFVDEETFVDDEPFRVISDENELP